MLDDFLRGLDAEQVTVNVYSTSLDAILEENIPFIEEAILNALVEEFVTQAQQIPEYNNPHADPLIDRLVENLYLQDGEGFAHVKVTLPGPNVFVFNEEVAGTAEDFASAKHVSRRNADNPELRRIFWKYGIYMPDVEGGSPETNKAWMKRAMEKLPSYDDIIQERLEKWGNKAPYWYFIENGNAGGGKPYPSFAGRKFINSFRSNSKKAATEFFRSLVDVIYEEVTKATEEALKNGQPVPPLSNVVRQERAISRSGNEIIRRRGTGGRFTFKSRGN